MTSQDPTRAERFLREQAGVLSASVWTARERLMACVTVVEGSELTPNGLWSACQQALGPVDSPAMIVLETALRRAA